MEATALSVGKSVLNGALGYAQSAIADEVALQLGVRRDHAFIKDELETMLAFLMATHEERDEHKVVKIWVKQVRDVAYDVEDSLQDFAVRLGRSSWWRILRTLRDRRCVAMRMKELRGKVEDVSQRNARYQLINGSCSKSVATTVGQSNMVGTSMSGAEEAMRQRNKAKLDLIRLIHDKKDKDLRAIAIWDTGNVFGETSIVRRAYDDLKRDNKFEVQAWISITHPFNPIECLQNIVRQLFVDSLHEQSSPGAHYDLRKMGTMKGSDLINPFQIYVSERSFLIVVSNLSTIEEWDQFKACFPNNYRKRSLFIVCTEKAEVASLCVGTDTEIPEHKQLSTDPTFFAFYATGSQVGTYQMDPGPSSSRGVADMNASANETRLTRMGTLVDAFRESQLIGRVDEKTRIIKLVLDNSSNEFEVISLCGMGGLGKTTLVKHVYQSQELSAMFTKRACITVKRPFDPKELINSLATQLVSKEEAAGNREKSRNPPSLTDTLEGQKYLVVLDDLSSTAEWDSISHYFPTTEAGSRILITTRVESIAQHCSTKEKNIHKLQTLGEKDACNLFTEKVFGNIIDLNEQYPELAEVAKLILKKCNGLPLAIVTIGGFLSKQPKTPMEWRKLNEHIGVEMEMNQELGTIKDILIKSYDGLPYHLKSCFLYLSIFPEDHNISRRRLVLRWIAEGYSSSEGRGRSLRDTSDSYFMELIDRSMILPFKKPILSTKGIDSCQVHDLMREICISKSTEENLVFRMEEGCGSKNILGTTRHLSISSNWEGDTSDFESATDLSRIRSLTVFGWWRPFFISDKMRLLRVLDLENTSGLVNHHLEQIGRLIHLKYISLRGCDNIYHLPDSWGNLLQLETLDIKGTRIWKLPKCITKLRKLQHFFGDSEPGIDFDVNNCGSWMKLCAVCCVPRYLNDVVKLGDTNRHDACTFWWHILLPGLASRTHRDGVVLPKGVRKLKQLHTLGHVNVARGKAILQDISRLTHLRKLGVTSISKENYPDFGLALARLSHLESLSVGVVGTTEFDDVSLDDVSTPPSNLESLKLRGALVKLPKWISGLQNLVKVKLHLTWLMEADTTMQVLGKLPNLAILRLLYSFQVGRSSLTFHQEAFPSLMCLGLDDSNLESLKFEDGATPKLELLQFDCVDKVQLVSGLASLASLKEVVISNYYVNKNKKFLECLEAQVGANPNGIVLKRNW